MKLIMTSLYTKYDMKFMKFCAKVAGFSLLEGIGEVASPSPPPPPPPTSKKFGHSPPTKKKIPIDFLIFNKNQKQESIFQQILGLVTKYILFSC